MPLKEQITNFARRIAERQPDEAALQRLVKVRKPLQIRFKDDGIIPNHPRWPLLIYRGAVTTGGRAFDSGTIIDALFARNGWGRSWRDTIYDFVHYHSQVHEVLGVARGSAKVEFGGVKGRLLTLRSGDIAILPAGTGHRLLDASRNFLVVGAYPPEGKYDECTDTRECRKNAAAVGRVKKPKSDPLYGQKFGLTKLWG
jgi:uncharacterized protein YjlB